MVITLSIADQLSACMSRGGSGYLKSVFMSSAIGVGSQCTGPFISFCNPRLMIFWVEMGMIINWWAKLNSGCKNMLYTLSL